MHSHYKAGRATTHRRAIPAKAWAQAPAEAPAVQPLLGAQSFSFRNFDFEGSIRCLRELGLEAMEYCGVHFPADADHAGFERVKSILTRAGVKTPCYGVEGFGGDGDANRRKFEFAKALGASVITADPAPEAFDDLEELCESYGIAIAIHNHGPGARYSVVGDTLGAVDGRHALIGACYDTGHAIRSGEKPDEGIRALGPRLIALHLKDWVAGGEEQVIGEGDMDLDAVARALKAVGFSGPIMFEYEESPDDPVPDMRRGLANWRRAWENA